MSVARTLRGLVGRALRLVPERSYDGAAAGRRWAGFVGQPSALAAVHAARGPILPRARSLWANNPLARAGCDVWVSALVGTGIKPRSNHPDPAVRERLNLAFEDWTDSADADGRGDFQSQQALIATHLVRDGEAFSLFTVAADGALRVRVLDPDHVDASLSRDLGGGAFIFQGVEHDVAGKCIAYHVRRDNPGLPFVTSFAVTRVPADLVCHLYRTDVAGQVRGMPWLAPVLLRLADYDQAIDAQLMRQKMAAMLAGFITDPNGDAGDFKGKTKFGVLETGLEPGTIKMLAPGLDYRQSEPAQIGAEAIQFLKVTAHEIAAGIGAPYAALTGDLSSVNYSSIRAGLVEFRRRVEAYQHNLLVFQFIRPVWRKWVTMEVLSGRLVAPGFFRDPEPYLSMKAIPPKFDWVDPAKDVKSELDAIRGRLMSRSQAVAARGLDIEALDREIAADEARAKKLGFADVTMKGKVA